MTTPGNLRPMSSWRIRPNRINRFPLHLFGSQCPKSQHAALKGGFSKAFDSSPSLAIDLLVWRGAPAYFFDFDEKLSFLCRTIFIQVGFLSLKRNNCQYNSRQEGLAAERRWQKDEKMYCFLLRPKEMTQKDRPHAKPKFIERPPRISPAGIAQCLLGRTL